MKNEALKELLYKMAEYLLFIGQRNSERHVLRPILEADIYISTMEQDHVRKDHGV